MDMHSMMMHDRPWFPQASVPMEQYPYYLYAINNLQAYYSSSEQQEEDNEHTGDEMPSETSGDQSPNADMFRLAFAASQWSKLVLNAEGLFNKLMSNNALPANEQILLKNQIEQWLCMKQEYEECIAADDSGSLQAYTENTRRSLERIEEVTETDEKTDESDNYQRKNCSGSDSEGYEEDVQSDIDSENSDFLDKLDEFMKKFKDETDEVVESQKNDFPRVKIISPVPKPVNNSSFVPIVKPIALRNPSSRRTSILPYSEMSNELAEFQKQNSNINLEQKDETSICPIVSQESKDKILINEKPSKSLEDESALSKAIVKAQSITMDTEQVNAIKILMISNEEKQSQIKKIQFDLDLVYKQVEELQNTISVKEQFIDDMLQSCEARNSAKQKFQKKRSKLEEKYRNAEKELNYLRIHRDTKDEASYYEEVEKYENLLMYYEKKMKDTKIIKQVAGNSAKTVIYLKNSLSASKQQMEELKQRLKDDEEHKKLLENEILANRIKIRELEDKYSVSSSHINAISESEDERNLLRLKIKADDKDKSLVEPNERISRLDNLLKEKMEIERVDNMDDKDILRQEIRSLRHIRDRLIDVKCTYTSERTSATIEKQRKLLLISEYVETIDAMIEQKNVMICGKSNYHDNKSNRLCLGLERLSHDELVTLFYKYFYKVIDLKDSSKNLEIQNATLEETLKKQEIESDTRMIMLQKSYERQISLLLNYYAEETSSSSYDNKLDKNRDFEKLIKENQALRRRLAHFDSLLKASGTAQAVHSNSVKNTKQVIKPELMQIALPSKPNKTTKVTRQGNKLIIQTSKREK